MHNRAYPGYRADCAMSRARTFDVHVCTPSSFPSSSSSSSSSSSATTPSTKRRVQQPPPRCWLTLAAVVAFLFFFFCFPFSPFPRRESPRSRRRCGSMMALAASRGFSRLPPLRPFPVLVHVSRDWRITFARRSAEAQRVYQFVRDADKKNE